MSALHELEESILHRTKDRLFSMYTTCLAESSDTTIYRHWHREFEFLYLERGSMILETEGQSILMREREAVYIPSGHLHSARAASVSPDRGHLFHALVFSPEFLSQSAPQYGPYVYPYVNAGKTEALHIARAVSWQKKILDLLEPLFALDPEELPSWELYAHGSLLSIWQLMLNHFLSDSPCTEDYSKLAEKLEPSLQAIRGQYDRDLTLAELAGISLVSEGQFCRLFKRLTGYTPFSYLNRCRILKSCEYLKDTDKKISEIASLCGYNNISYFNREFQKLMRQSPRQYRRNSTLHHPHEGL